MMLKLNSPAPKPYSLLPTPRHPNPVSSQAALAAMRAASFSSSVQTLRARSF
jgi:hypothetical protein